MASKDHSGEVLWVYPPRGDGEEWWCVQYGNVTIPEGWVSLAPGDAFVTRQVKSMGAYWMAVKRRKGYTEKLGLWAPEENIRAAQEQAEETGQEREAKRATGRKYRENKEVKYREEFAGAVFDYLDFAPKYRKLAREISGEVAEHAAVVGSGRVGRAAKLTLEDKAALAARAYIRHHYTKYEDRLDAHFSLDRDHYLYREIKSGANDAVDQFLHCHR
ncbi:MAG: DUF2293 domain-containing protein [Chloroflexi bacterium]|nr:DUF2293 domain-containing protein [Chloroflexota bacterium]